MENAMKMVNRAVRRWEGGRAKNRRRRPNRMENGESRGSAMGGGRAQTGRGNTLDIWHFVTKMYKNKKEQRQIQFFGAARQKSQAVLPKTRPGKRPPQEARRRPRRRSRRLRRKCFVWNFLEKDVYKRPLRQTGNRAPQAGDPEARALFVWKMQ